MSTAIAIAVGVICIGGFALLAVFGTMAVRLQSRLRKQQQRELPHFPRWAADRGMTYAPRDDSWASVSQRQPFGIGIDARAEYVFAGTVAGWSAAVFEYNFVADTEAHRKQIAEGRPAQRVGITAAAVRLPAPRPMVWIRPEDAVTRKMQSAGLQDLKLESHAFNERFLVKYEDSRFAYDVLNPLMMEWLMSLPKPNAVDFRVENGWLVTYQGGPLTLDRAGECLEMVRQFAERIPTHVWSR